MSNFNESNVDSGQSDDIANSLNAQGNSDREDAFEAALSPDGIKRHEREESARDEGTAGQSDRPGNAGGGGRGI